MNALLDAALDYAGTSWPVFPCLPRAKEPAIKGGFHSATTNPATIRRLWRRTDTNIGIPTGLVSGFWVLDIDADRGGEQSLRSIQARYGSLPATREVITGGGGRHIWFQYSGSVPSTADRIAPGLDTRGDGGYVIVPPSIHASGRAYQWVDRFGLLAFAPDWLLQLARKKPKISEQALATLRTRAPGSSNAYGHAALEYEATSLATTPRGSRNHALNRSAFALFQLVAGGELSEQEVLHRLKQAAYANGLMSDPDDGPYKVDATIQSARRAGLQHPRSRTGAA